ncbi:glycine, alanine and asparagine-rich protein-like [Monomorium pharaonis]|uniref:glycine, alanine and asparagine-rich protein-like n=1 Tax=Monomorium pharaonis TaxID=307658 RepID=UPI0017478A05|nr:glycine, alanine and asparagine-rich protein-like [Monomorium pharaonis]
MAAGSGAPSCIVNSSSSSSSSIVVIVVVPAAMTTGGGGGGGGDGGGSSGAGDGGGGGDGGDGGGGSAGWWWWTAKMMVGWSDGGAPSAQAVPSDADAVTGAQRDPTQLDLTSHIRSRIKRRGLGKWNTGKVSPRHCSHENPAAIRQSFRTIAVGVARASHDTL